jgi:hypothetical protein
VTKQGPDLVEFFVARTTEIRTSSSEVIGTHRYTDALSILLHDVEHGLGGQTIGSDLALSRNGPQNRPTRDPG